MKGKQAAFMKALLEESTIRKAASKAGIAPATAYKYLKDPDFKKELDSKRNECITDTVRYLQSKLTLCSETLIKIIENPETSSQIKINAINAVYANCKAMTETGEIITRIEELEQIIEGGEAE